jgi:hypothetical protein
LSRSRDKVGDFAAGIFSGLNAFPASRSIGMPDAPEFRPFPVKQRKYWEFCELATRESVFGTEKSAAAPGFFCRIP